MRTFWAIIVVSLAIGIGGIWTLADAVSDYTGTLKTYTRLEIRYEPGSFVWLDSEYARGRATLTFTNNSPADARIDNLNLSLLFNGEFAGANYDRIDAFVVPRGESHTVKIEFQVTSRSIQAQGGSAQLGLRGSVVVHFNGIERELALRVRGTIGQVDTVEPS